MAVQINKGRALGTLNITPLIDVVFLLLIFFLVATRFAEEDRELDVSLPSAAEAKPLVLKPKELFVNVNHSGTYYMGGRMLSLEELKEALNRSALDNPVNQSVVIRADRRCTWQHVISAIDACHSAGIHDVRPTTAIQRGGNGRSPAPPGT